MTLGPFFGVGTQIGCGLGGGSDAGVVGCTFFICWGFCSEIPCTLGSDSVLSGCFGACTLGSPVLHFVVAVPGV
eukprot:5025433-Ditylum_brightwellii.AAC.1